jgi:hypothetical protein
MDSKQWSVLNKVPLMMAELRPKHMWTKKITKIKNAFAGWKTKEKKKWKDILETEQIFVDPCIVPYSQGNYNFKHVAMFIFSSGQRGGVLH